MIPGRPLLLPPQNQSDFDAEEKDAHDEIARRERFAKAIWRVLPCFVTQSALDRMGLETVAGLLEEFHANLRDYFCADVEFYLARMMDQRNNPQSPWKQPKPTPEQLIAAQINVERMETAVNAMNDLAEKEKYAFAGPVALMRPMIEMQLDQARQQLEYIQAAMEEPDEATQSPMSNEKPDGEGAVSDEAK